MARNHSVQRTHGVTRMAKKITQLRDAGNALALTCDPKGHNHKRKMQIPQILRKNLKEPRNPKHLAKAKPTPNNPIQKTNFATTPNT